MLVLGRKKNETIAIDNGQIMVTIIQIRGDKVKVGITAPNTISVDRHEVYLSKLRQGIFDGPDQDTFGQTPHAPGEGGEVIENHAGGSKELLCDEVKSGSQRKQSRRA